MSPRFIPHLDYASVTIEHILTFVFFTEKCHREIRYLPPPHLSHLPCAKTRRRKSTNSRPIQTKQIFEPGVIPASNYSTSKIIPSETKVALETGLKGCISSCGSAPSLQKISCLSMGRKRVLLQGNAFRTQNCTGSLHRLNGPTTKITQGQKSILHSLSRRLDNRFGL